VAEQLINVQEVEQLRDNRVQELQLYFEKMKQDHID